MQDINAHISDPPEDPKPHLVRDEDLPPYWDIAQNQQIATPDGPASREELEEEEANGEVFVTDYRL